MIIPDPHCVTLGVLRDPIELSDLTMTPQSRTRFHEAMTRSLWPPHTPTFSIPLRRTPTAERKMRHLVFNSFLFAWLLRIVLSRSRLFSKIFLFLLHPLFLRLLVFNIVHLLGPPREPPRANFLSCYVCLNLTALTIFPYSASHWPPENRRCWTRGYHFFRCSRNRLCVQLHQKHTLSPVLRNQLANTRVLDIRFLRPEHDDVSLIEMSHARNPTVCCRQRPKTSCCTSFYRPEEFQSHVSFHMYRTSACCRKPHRIRRLRARNTLLSDRLYALGNSRFDTDLHDLFHHVNCFLHNLQSTFCEIHNVMHVASTRTLRFVCFLLSFA